MTQNNLRILRHFFKKSQFFVNKMIHAAYCALLLNDDFLQPDSTW